MSSLLSLIQEVKLSPRHFGGPPLLIWTEPGEDAALIRAAHGHRMAPGQELVMVSWEGIGMGHPKPELCTARSVAPVVPLAKAEIARRLKDPNPSIQHVGTDLEAHWRGLCQQVGLDYDEIEPCSEARDR
jgi:hypothetical protein